MKKLFFSLVFVMVSLLSYSQDSTKIPLSDSGKLTVNKVYEDVKAGVQGLAKALKAPTEHVYYIMVRQQVVISSVYLIVFFAGIIGLIWFFKAFKSKEEWKGNYDPTPLGIFRVIQGILSVVLIMVGIGHIESILTGFINPEYGAIEDIVNFVK